MGQGVKNNFNFLFFRFGLLHQIPSQCQEPSLLWSKDLRLAVGTFLTGLLSNPATVLDSGELFIDRATDPSHGHHLHNHGVDMNPQCLQIPRSLPSLPENVKESAQSKKNAQCKKSGTQQLSGKDNLKGKLFKNISYQSRLH